MKKLMLSLLLLVLATGAAQAQVVDAGWSAFTIRASTVGSVPAVIQDPGTPYEGALEIAITLGGQKAGLATDQLNGAKVSEIARLHIDRLDDINASGSLYGPYFNIWVTDGMGNYAVLANEPSDAEWAANRWDVADWNYLKTKRCKVYEVTGAAAGGQPGTSWVATYTGLASNLIFFGGCMSARGIYRGPTTCMSSLEGTGAFRQTEGVTELFFAHLQNAIGREWGDTGNKVAVNEYIVLVALIVDIETVIAEQ